MTPAEELEKIVYSCRPILVITAWIVVFALK